MNPHPTRGKKLRRDLLTERELNALLEACGDGDAGVRNKAFIALVAATALRMSDVLSLTSDGVGLRKRRVWLAPERQLAIHPHAVPYLRKWLRLRRRLDLGDVPVFCSLDGSPLSASYLRSLLPRLAKKAKLHKRVHAEGLRHVFARRAFEADVTMRTIQLQLGHSNVATTLAYMEGLGLHHDFDHFDAAFS